MQQVRGGGQAFGQGQRFGGARASAGAMQERPRQGRFGGGAGACTSPHAHHHTPHAFAHMRTCPAPPRPSLVHGQPAPASGSGAISRSKVAAAAQQGGTPAEAQQVRGGAVGSGRTWTRSVRGPAWWCTLTAWHALPAHCLPGGAAGWALGARTCVRMCARARPVGPSLMQGQPAPAPAPAPSVATRAATQRADASAAEQVRGGAAERRHMGFDITCYRGLGYSSEPPPAQPCTQLGTLRARDMAHNLPRHLARVIRPRPPRMRNLPSCGRPLPCVCANALLACSLPSRMRT